MKKAGRNKRPMQRGDELAPEYRFDYSKSKPNRFAARLTGDVRVVVLDPDVARVFRSAKRVNEVLRAQIAKSGKARKRRAS